MCIRLANRWLIVALTAAAATSIAIAEEPLHREVDRLIAEQLQRQGITQAAAPASDEEFLRRVSLDLTGVIPTAESVRAFVADRAADKRIVAIDRLLASDEHAVHLAAVFDVMLMERRPDKYVPAYEWRSYLAESFHAGKPLDKLVYELLDSDGAEPGQRPAAKFILDRELAADVLVRDLGRLLLGVDLQCAQCHDHPSVTAYKHEHYYGLQAFVAGYKLFKQPDGAMVLQENMVREVSFASVFDPTQSKKTGPRLPGGEVIDVPEFKAGDEYVEKPSAKVRAIPKFSLRHALAESLPRAETPGFARNLANRLWAHMLGVGLVQPLDMHHAGNPPSHPELMTLLSDQLVAMKFDSRQFLRELALSETYQRSSLAPPDVVANDLPIESYALANLKGLGPEQLFASLITATGNEAALERQIDDAIAAKPEAEREKLAADEALRKRARADERAKLVAEFAEQFGAAAGTPEPEFQPSLPQALFLANGKSVAAWLASQHENLATRLTAMTDAGRTADELYYCVLSRGPTAEEQALVEKQLAGENRLLAVQTLIWSLLASAEFRLNH